MFYLYIKTLNASKTHFKNIFSGKSHDKTTFCSKKKTQMLRQHITFR